MSARVLVPVLLDLTGLRVLFVGAGEGTRVKLASLVDANPTVRVVSPKVSEPVEHLLKQLSEAEVFRRAFEPSDLEGISLVYGFTDDEDQNAELARLCRERGLWSNVAHHRQGGSFTSPAQARRDGVLASFHSLEGKPALAVAARDAWRTA